MEIFALFPDIISDVAVPAQMNWAVTEAFIMLIGTRMGSID